MVARVKFAMPAFNAKNEAKPVLTLLAKAGPGDGSAQQHTFRSQPGLLKYFAAHPCNNILIRFYAPAQTIVFAKMYIIRSLIAVNHQDLFAIRRKNIAQRC